MLIGTHHGTILAIGDTPALVHVAPSERASPLRLGGPGIAAAALASHFEGAVAEIDGDALRVRINGRYLCAAPDGALTPGAEIAGQWETFRLIEDVEAEAAIGIGADGAAETARFARRIADLRAAGEPVRVQFAALWSALPGFLNVDLGFYDPAFIARHPDDYFAFPYVGVRIPVPDASVDYIYHEDFIEHIDQVGQVQFLAEARRILKPGGIHRINTPDFAWSMTRFSAFESGAAGVYTGERRWQHVAMLTRAGLDEVARMVGYSDVRFTARGGSASPHAGKETRPLFDRDAVAGNIYADLVR